MGSDDGRIFLAESKNGAQFSDAAKIIHNIKGGFVTSMVYDDQTNRVYATASDKSIHVFNGETGELLNSVTGEHTKSIYDVKLYPEGSDVLLASCSGDNTVKTWKADETGNSLVLA